MTGEGEIRHRHAGLTQHALHLVLVAEPLRVNEAHAGNAGELPRLRERELELLEPRAVLALGAIAWASVLRVFRTRGIVVPAMKEPIAAIASAGPARPFCVIA